MTNLPKGTEHDWPEVDAWQPIETAPKDKPFLGYDDDTSTQYAKPFIYIWEWDSFSEDFKEASGEQYMTAHNLTHWMPLPAPPKQPRT